jgi:23S rRNA pseudouridine955/2504/2580 synthase
VSGFNRRSAAPRARSIAYDGTGFLAFKFEGARHCQRAGRSATGIGGRIFWIVGPPPMAPGAANSRVAGRWLGVAANEKYKRMNALSKDAASRIEVHEDAAGQRIDNFLTRILKGVPKSHIYRILRSGEVRLNSRRVGPHARLAIGDELRIPPIRATTPAAGRRAPPPPDAQPVPPILYEDDQLIALAKPAGMAVHGGSGISYGVIERLRQDRPAAKVLELVHRLDRDTSGVLLVAKKRAALTSLHAQLRDGSVDKRYDVLVRGKWRGALRKVDAALTSWVNAQGERRVKVDPQGRAARTIFRLQRTWPSHQPPLALLEAELETGRTHQIRVHLAHLGYPLAGDDKYGDFAWNRTLAKQGLKRMFLHARRISFAHPADGRAMSVEAPLPEDLRGFLQALTLGASPASGRGEAAPRRGQTTRARALERVPRGGG